jgi:hypothetical protein
MMNKILNTLLLLCVGCSTQPKNTIYYQAYDAKWDDPTINPIFDTEAEAKDYAHRNTMGGLNAKDDSHSYVVRPINYRYEIRQVNDWMDEILHTTNSKEDGVKYVEQFTSAHSDLFMYDLRTGNIITTSTP